MSRDNLDSMRVPNVASGTLPGLAALGITPTALEAVAPRLPRRLGRPAAPGPLAGARAAAAERSHGCASLRCAQAQPARRSVALAWRSDARTAMQLCIGNKNYSSWSMRPWVLLTQAGIAVRGGAWCASTPSTPGSPFKTRARRAVSPTGKVPVLVDDGFAVWDTLAIAEYLAERFPDKQLWPRRRAGARPRAQRLRRDALRLRRAAQPLPDEHRGRAARDRRPRAGASRPAVRADVARLVRCGASCWPSTAGRCCSARFAHRRRLLRAGVHAPAHLRACRCRPRSRPTSTRVRRCPACRPGSTDALAEQDFLRLRRALPQRTAEAARGAGAYTAAA